MIRSLKHIRSSTILIYVYSSVRYFYTLSLLLYCCFITLHLTNTWTLPCHLHLPCHEEAVWTHHDLILYVSVNSYGHVETVSSPNHTFSWASLIKWLTSTLHEHTFACNWQQPFLNQQKEENDCRNYFMINLHKRMGLGRNQTCNTWICSQTCYRLFKVDHFSQGRSYLGPNNILKHSFLRNH